MPTSVVSPEPRTARTADPETHTTPETLSPQAEPRWRLVGLGLASGLMLFLCHFPMAWSWLAWVALVPFLAIVRSPARTRWLFWSSWLAGLAYFYPAISWMTVADARMVACWVMLATYCSLYFPLTVYLVRRLEQNTRLPLVLTVPVVWIALEYFRAFFGTGFPWYMLAHTQHNFLPFIQMADLGGTFLVSGVLVAVNVLAFEAVARWPAARRFAQLPALPPKSCCGNLLGQAVVVALVVGAALAYGAWCLSTAEFEKGPRVALLQANLDQRLRIDAHRSPEAAAKVSKAYRDLSDQAGALEPRPLLIVWPETSSPDPWFTVAPNIDLARQPKDVQQSFAKRQAPVRRIALAVDPPSVRRLPWEERTRVLVGINTWVQEYGDNSKRYNSALLLCRGADLARYDKQHRVPFGEYVPFRDWLPLMKTFAPYDFDYSISIGDSLTRLEVGKYRFGVLVCYEDTDPFLARDYAVATQDGAPVDFLVNISNDGWFNGSAEHEEHLAICRFRAIENRKAVARAVNMGVSAVIDGNGRVLAPVKSKTPGQEEVWTVPADAATLEPAEWRHFKKTDGILVVDMPLDRRGSLYASWGDWLPTGCWAVVLGGWSWGWLRRRKNESVAGEARSASKGTR
jgi:apolipoprotein N-acyltransferase